MIEMSRPTQEKSEKLGLNKWSDSQNSKWKVKYPMWSVGKKRLKQTTLTNIIYEPT